MASDVKINSSIVNNNTTDADIQRLAADVSNATIKTKITDWKNQPTVNDLLANKQDADSTHNAQISKINEWLKNLYVKTNKNSIKNGRSGIAPKVIRRLAEWRYTSLGTSILNEKNLFKVTAQSPSYLEASIQNSLLLNYQFNNLLDKVFLINHLVRTLVNEGTAIARVGWYTEQQTIEKTIPVYEYVTAAPEEQQMIMQAMQAIGQEQQQTQEQDSANTETFKQLDPIIQESVVKSTEYGIPVIARDTGHTQKVKEQIETKNRPDVKIINNADLIIDPTCNGDFSKAKFCVYMYKTNLSELRQINLAKPDTYHNLDALDPTASTTGELGSSGLEAIANMPDQVFNDRLRGNNDSIDNQFKFNDVPRKELLIYEYWGYWDIDGTGIVQSFMAHICNGILIRMERNPFPDSSFPFVPISYLPVKESVYGEPDSELVTDNQAIITALTRSIVDLNARSANGQTAIPKGYLDALNQNKFRKGEDYEYNPNGVHPHDAVYMHTASEIPQSIMAFIQQQAAEAESATGVKSFQNGIDGNAYGQVVQGMNQAVSAMTQRESDITFRISNGLKQIGEKILRMNTEWLSEEEVIAVTQSQFVSIKKEDLKGDFFLSVELKSASEAEGKAQQLAFIAQTMGADIDWNIRKMMFMEIGNLYNLDNFVMQLKEYEPEPDPIEQELRQLEVEEQKAKISKLQAEEEYYRKRSEFIQAQVDKENLDFVESQEGVKHARQKELIEAQAHEQNKGKLASEAIKGTAMVQKAKLDKEAKEALARAKSNENSNKGTNSNRQTRSNGSKLPNPELNSLPDGLFTADGLGNYVRGDTVGYK